MSHFTHMNTARATLYDRWIVLDEISERHKRACVRVCTHVREIEHTRTHTHTHLYTHPHRDTRPHTHARTHTCVRTVILFLRQGHMTHPPINRVLHSHTHTQTHLHTRTHTPTHVHAQTHTHMHTCILAVIFFLIQGHDFHVDHHFFALLGE